MLSDEHKAALKAIDSLDFKMLKMKLCLPVERGGKGWPKQKAHIGEMWYKRFLKLKLYAGNIILVPTDIIDQFWHAHILDTFRYRKDCDNIFGHYLDHSPYFGLQGDN